jgi:hypothetical protein
MKYIKPAPLTTAVCGIIATLASLCLFPSALSAAGPKSAKAQPAKSAGRPSQTPDAKDKKDRERSKRRVDEIRDALYDYWDTNGVFPPDAIVGKAGKPLLSWRVLLLPHLGQDKLFKQFKLQEPWDSVHNKKLLDRMPSVYAPGRGKTNNRYSTFYQVFTGPGTIFEGHKGIRTTDFTKGTSRTVMLAEAGEAVPWTKPADLVYDPHKPLPKLGGMFGGDFHILLGDGVVYYVKKGYNQKVMRALVTQVGGEVADYNDLNRGR